MQQNIFIVLLPLVTVDTLLDILKQMAVVVHCGDL